MTPTAAKLATAQGTGTGKAVAKSFIYPDRIYPQIYTSLYVYTYIHQSIQIRMQETQTGMAPFFKTDGCFTLTLTMTN